MSENYQRVVLDDGVVVIVEPSHAVPIVSMVVALRSGAAHDPPGKEGLARIAMRMLRRGCDGLGAQEVDELIDTLGGEMAVDTGVSSVSLHAQVIGRSVDAFVDLMANMLSRPTFPDDELERLKRETIAEIIDARDQDRVVAQKAFSRTLFAGHPYGRTSSGTTASVSAITGADVRAFYQQHVVRKNIVVGLAGDVTKERGAAIAQRLTAKLPEGAAQPDPVTEPKPLSGRRLLFVDKPERTQTQILIGNLGTAPRDVDHTALTVANAVFGGTFTSRLMKEVRSKRGWSYGAYARLGVDRHRHSFSMWTFPAATDAAACIALEIELLEKLVAEGLTPEELGFIQQYLVRSYAFEIDTASKRLHQALDVEVLGLPADYYTSYTARVQGVSADSANAAVRARIDPKNLLVTIVGTADEIKEAVEKAIPSLAESRVVAFDAE